MQQEQQQKLQKIQFEFKKVVKHCFTLNDNKTYDIVAISYGIIVLVACAVFIISSVRQAPDKQPDYGGFFGGLAAIVIAFGVNKGVDKDKTKIQTIEDVANTTTK
jgi:hypothetical protein